MRIWRPPERKIEPFSRAIDLIKPSPRLFTMAGRRRSCCCVAPEEPVPDPYNPCDGDCDQAFMDSLYGWTVNIADVVLPDYAKCAIWPTIVDATDDSYCPCYGCDGDEKYFEYYTWRQIKRGDPEITDDCGGGGGDCCGGGCGGCTPTPGTCDEHMCWASDVGLLDWYNVSLTVRVYTGFWMEGCLWVKCSVTFLHYCWWLGRIICNAHWCWFTPNGDSSFVKCDSWPETLLITPIHGDAFGGIDPYNTEEYCGPSVTIAPITEAPE